MNRITGLSQNHFVWDFSFISGSKMKELKAYCSIHKVSRSKFRSSAQNFKTYIYIHCFGFAEIRTKTYIKQMCKSLVRRLAEHFHAWLTPFQCAIIVITWTKHTTSSELFPRLWILLKLKGWRENHKLQTWCKRENTTRKQKRRDTFINIAFEMWRHSYSVFLFWQLITDKRFGTSQKPARHYSC